MHSGMHGAPMMAGAPVQYPSYGQMAGARPTMAAPMGMPPPMTYTSAPRPAFGSMQGHPMPAQGMPMMQAGIPGPAQGSFLPPATMAPVGGVPQPMRPPATVVRAMPNEPMPLPVAPQGLAAAASDMDHGLQIGDLVKLRGHAAYPHLEGQTLRVEKVDVGDGSGNVMIRLEANKFGFVDPGFLEKVGEDPDIGAEADPALLQQPAGPEFAPGDFVQIINLEARPQHNGKTAFVESVSPAGIRVHLEDNSNGAVVLDLMPGYLQLIERGTLGAAADGSGGFGGVVEGGPAAGAQVGDMVRIVGLASRPQHNGRLARVEVPNSGGNVIVSLADNVSDGVTKLAVNAAYLEPADGLQPGAAPGGAHWLTQGMQDQMRVGGGGMAYQQHGAAPQMAQQHHMAFGQPGHQVMMPGHPQPQGFAAPHLGMVPPPY